MNRPKKIAVVGPESCGKTSLAQQLTVLLEGIFVPEVARYYLEAKQEKYDLNDLILIHRKQLDLELEAESKGDRWIVCDTTPLVIEIWANEVFKTVPDEFINKVQEQSYGLYLLCSPDLPWEPDPLRENPKDRNRLFQLYKNQLDQRNLPYSVISGKGSERLSMAFESIKKTFGL